jgi:SAM-dependent methyltransferase
MQILPDAARRDVLARYRGQPVPDLGYATVRDFCDSADFLPQICGLDGDLKNVQRPWMVKAILGRVPLGARILEIGAGQPVVAGALQELGYAVTVVDPYEGAGNGPTAYEEYVRAFPKLRIVRAEFARDVPALGNEKFDAICSISVLEHVRHDRLPGLFEGIGRYLTGGGQSIHCVDHVLAGAGAQYHEEGLQMVLSEQSAIDGSPSRDTPELLRRIHADLETFYLSPQGHHLWRGGKPYDQFPFRKVVSIQTCARRR